MKHLLVFTLLLFYGCDSSNNNSRPYIQGSNYQKQSNAHKSPKVITAKIDSEKEQEIAKINMQKEIEIQRLKNELAIKEAHLSKEVELNRAKVNKDVEIIKNSTTKEIHKESTKMQMWWLISVVSLILLIVVFIYLGLAKSRKERLKMHQDTLEQELRIKEQEMKLHMAQKVLDTLASGNLSEKNEEILLKSLNNSDNPKKLKH